MKSSSSVVPDEVSGKIRYGRLIVADGGEISGDVQQIDAVSGCAGEDWRAHRAPAAVAAAAGVIVAAGSDVRRIRDLRLIA
jgi:hypothetical protein